jgi:hypothetical protein
MKESPLFSKTYEFIAWVIPVTVRFPRSQRFVMAEVIQKEAIQFQALIIEASHHHQPGATLLEADSELDKLRTHLRLSKDLALISFNQYEHAARLLTEVGKLLGGWMKSVARG